MMCRRGRVVFFLGFLAVSGCSYAQSNVAEQYLIAAANQERAHVGLAPLAPDPALNAAAHDHVREMARRGDISHQFDGEPGLFPRIQAYSQGFDGAAENVAYAPTIDRIDRGWMESEGHRANLLSPGYDAIGVAVVAVGREIYAVEDFGHHVTREAPVEPPAARPMGPQADASHAAINQEARYLMDAANRERGQVGLPALRWDGALTHAAAAHAARMADRGTISHQFPGEPELSARGASAGVKFSLISENVAESPSVAQVHGAWMQSEGHRQNILDPHIDSIGIAVVVRKGQRYAVQDFARITESLTLEQQEGIVGAQLDGAGLTLMPDAGDARSTCATSSGFHGQKRPGFVMRYTTADLTALPEQLTSYLTSGTYHEAIVGACTQGGKNSFSTYRIAILLYR